MRWSPLRIAAVALIASVLVFALNAVRPVLPWVVVWIPSMVSLAVLLVELYRTSRLPTLPGVVARFWRHCFVIGLFVAGGHVAEAIDVTTARDISGMHLAPGQLALHGVAIVVMMYALLRLPFGKQTRSERFRVVLDAGTVMLGCAVFVWHFATRPALAEGVTAYVFTSLAVTIVALLAVFAIAKFMMTSRSFLDPGTLRLIGIGLVIGAFSATMRPWLASIDVHLFPEMVAMPALSYFGMLAALHQQRIDYGPRRGYLPPRKRTFSLIPYLGVAAVDVLLIVVTWRGNDPDLKVVVAGAVLLTALVVVRQITAFIDNGRLLHRLDHNASHDALTQLPNRVLFHERLVAALTAPVDRPVAVALIDLDGFKEVNDTLGHEVGDQLLIAVAERLAGCVRTGDTVARLGGDEFVVVLDDADPAAATLAAQRMIDALRAPVVKGAHELPIGASIGIADGRSGDDPSILLRYADIAMYRAKAVPGTVALHHDPGMVATVTDHAELAADLREALDSGQLRLLYQPIVHLGDGRVLGAEALVRWAHPTRGTLTPDAFIPAAERTGLIVGVTAWVLRTAFTQLAAWPEGQNLNINISARDLREDNFAATVRELMDAAGADPARVTLEITETMALDTGPAVAATLQALRDLGVRLSLDDFGTGNSTLTMVSDCPVDEIKLDRSFTQRPTDAAVPIASAVIHLAGGLGLDVVAEGVETSSQAERLRTLGYTAAQGYLYSHPLTADDFAAFLAASATDAVTPR